jgi:hypothetical protein
MDAERPKDFPARAEASYHKFAVRTVTPGAFTSRVRGMLGEFEMASRRGRWSVLRRLLPQIAGACRLLDECLPAEDAPGTAPGRAEGGWADV